MSNEQKLEWLNNLLANLKLMNAINANRSDILGLLDVGVKIIINDTTFSEREKQLFDMFCVTTVDHPIRKYYK